jgi:hypothetical protein
LTVGTKLSLGGQQQDPLVALKQRELDLRALDYTTKSLNEGMINMEMQRKSDEFEETIGCRKDETRESMKLKQRKELELLEKN